MPVVKLPGNLEMYYEDDCYTDPWRSPESVETVILHHGNAKNSRLWYAWVPLLARQYRVIRVDARGFGKSTVPPKGYDWSLSGFGTDLTNLMDQLDIEKMHLIGETIGGTIALQFAYDHPDRVHTITACTSPYNFVGVASYLEYHKLVQEKGVETWVRQTADRRLEPGHSDPAHHEWYAQQMINTSAQVVTETLAYLSTQDLTPILPKINTPALVLVGQNSAMNTADRAQSMAQLLANGRLVEITGGTGYIQHSDPEGCVAAWREFVGALGH